MNNTSVSNITVRDAKIMFKNFSGKATQFNPAGKRNFSLVLNPEMAEVLAKDGWRVKPLKPRDGEDVPQAHLPVEVRFDILPPKIVLVTSAGMNTLDEETVGMLDWAEITKIDVTIRPRAWENNGRTGIKAYLKTMYVTIEEDELDADYMNVPRR